MGKRPSINRYIKDTTALVQHVKDQILNRDHIFKLLKANLEATQEYENISRQTQDRSLIPSRRLNFFYAYSPIVRHPLHIDHPTSLHPLLWPQPYWRISSMLHIVLTPYSKIHLIFYLSCLKKHLSNSIPIATILPPIGELGQVSL